MKLFSISNLTHPTSSSCLSSFGKINAAAEVIYEAVDPNANIIFGALVDEGMTGEISITVIATGFPVGSPGGDEPAAATVGSSVASGRASIGRDVAESSQGQRRAAPGTTPPQEVEVSSAILF